jgi:hypothetical protein
MGRGFMVAVLLHRADRGWKLASRAESRVPGSGRLSIAKPFGHGPGVQEQAFVFGQSDDRIL